VCVSEFPAVEEGWSRLGFEFAFPSKLRRSRFGAFCYARHVLSGRSFLALYFHSVIDVGLERSPAPLLVDSADMGGRSR